MKFIKKERNGFERKITILDLIKINYLGKRYLRKQQKSELKKCKINISDEVLKAVIAFSKDCTKNIDTGLLDLYVNIYLDIKVFMDRISNTFSYFGKIDKNTKIVEIGSGIGTSCICVKALTNADIIGVEPAPESYALLHDCIKTFKEANPDLDYNILNCAGENIPLEDGSVDYIYSFEVLEHVKDPYKVLSEIYRLLKKGGRAYISTCNYDSFYEGHYKVFWNPFVSLEKNKKRIIKSGRSPKFFDELNFITKKQIKKYLQRLNFSKIEFDPPSISIPVYADLEIQKPESLQFLEVENNRKYLKLANFIEKLKVRKFLKHFDREYKLYFILEK